MVSADNRSHDGVWFGVGEVSRLQRSGPCYGVNPGSTVSPRGSSVGPWAGSSQAFGLGLGATPDTSIIHAIVVKVRYSHSTRRTDVSATSGGARLPFARLSSVAFVIEDATLGLGGGLGPWVVPVRGSCRPCGAGGTGGYATPA